MSVKLSFSFGQDSTNLHGDGLQLDNPLFRILAAIHARGSIGAAAEAVETRPGAGVGVLGSPEALEP